MLMIASVYYRIIENQLTLLSEHANLNGQIQLAL